MYNFERKGKEPAFDDDDNDLNPAMGRVKKLMGGAMDEFIGWSDDVNNNVDPHARKTLNLNWNFP